jgi:hypothetical protein
VHFNLRPEILQKKRHGFLGLGGTRFVTSGGSAVSSREHFSSSS